jgi:transposase InsO family protein
LAGLRLRQHVTDVYVSRIAGWNPSASLQAQFMLEAMELTLHARLPAGPATADNGVVLC